MALATALTLGASPAAAVTLTLESESKPQPGITFRHYTTTSPTTHTWVALVDLCTDRVHVDATRAPSSLQTAGAWASARGVQLATNGDFFQVDPVRVYGHAVGDGVAWPRVQTGNDPAYSSEWYYQDYGWIAFLWDGVEYTHTKWVKNNAATFGTLGGWRPNDVAPPLPPGTLALVSGFPELVVEGTKITCSSPTATNCFPDRGDMRERHPRTAMGITEDRATFILAVVDGRTTISLGMYGTELSDLMFQLGAWEAFNVDGGGSSTMWVNGTVRNSPSDGSQRAVANHWGVFAGTAGGRTVRPGHCAQEAACGVIPPEGGIVDDDSPCFQHYGSAAYWRTEASGQGGGLHWTNAWQTSQPDDWAWWRLELAEGGEYLVEYWAEPGFAVFDRTHYLVQAGGATTTLSIDQSAGTGWRPLGTFAFAAGGQQFVAVYDDIAGTVADDQHVVADALRLTRVGGPADAGVTPDAGESPDGGEPIDAGAGDADAGDADATSPPTKVGGGCGCRVALDGAGPSYAPLLAALVIAALLVRRRRRA